ncbi:invasin domain 3-containing protein [Hafnia alvei]|nr:invasin domain 3-containing protein [Hafnia alvei]NLS53213.1 hypothetical protein [Hafnia alvei]
MPTINPAMHRPKAESLVIVSSAAVSILNSTLTPMELQLPNDGTSTARLTLVLRDANNHLVSGIADDIKTTLSPVGRGQPDATVSAFSEDMTRMGTYSAIVTAGENMGQYKITPEIHNVKIAPATLYVGSTPAISDLSISGKLELGEQLTGDYQFNNGGGHPKDMSLYQWGNKGQTAGLNGAETIVTSGSVPGYTLVANDVGQVKELSVQARNGVDTLGNILTVTSENGGEGGTVIDPMAAPSISNVAISGELLVGKQLNGRYTFAANTGNKTDRSEYQWGVEGTTANVVANENGNAIEQSGTIPSYTVQSSDAGQVLEMSVRAKNGASVYGNSATVTSVPGTDGNEIDKGGPGGTVIDPAAEPSISNVKIDGELLVGKQLNGRYTFAANTGDTTDRSEYQWGVEGTTANVVANESGSAIEQSGTIPSYTVQSSDAGQVLEMSVRAKNGASVYGNSATVTSVPGTDGNETDKGGPGGTVIDPMAAPSISNLIIRGTLNSGQTLKGSYIFATNTGNTLDKSEYLWGTVGTTKSQIESNKGKVISKSGTLPDYVIANTDVGKVLEATVRAKNGASVIGNISTVTTAQAGGGNNTDDGYKGQIIDKYQFNVVPGNRTLGETLSYQFSLNAKGPNGTNVTVPYSEIKWKTENSSVATVNSSGVVTGVNAGKTNVVAYGLYKNNEFEAKAVVTITALKYSPYYGGTIAGDKSGSDIVTPPDYMISMQCGFAVDSMGGVGGTGGSPLIIRNVRDVTSITVKTGISRDYGNRTGVGQIIYKYKNGSQESCGEQPASIYDNLTTSVYNIPNGYVLQGYEVKGNELVNRVRFVVSESGE